MERARQLLKNMDLYEYRDVHPAALSGGQKQRLAVACALFSEREILLLDEPTSGLDGANMRRISDALKDAASSGKTVVVITHDPEFMEECCQYCFSFCSVREGCFGSMYLNICMAVNQDRNGKVLYSAVQGDGNHFEASLIISWMAQINHTAVSSGS